MKLPDLFVNAVTTFDGKALAKGQKQIGGFEKSVKSLAKAFGVTFGAAALAQFGKKSVKAFAEDEAAAARLTKAVENLGLGFEDTRITRFIADLEKSAAVADDILRPAFQTLISTTGSFTKSQDLLNLALEISAGSGIDAAEVAKDLSLAYLGQTKGIAKYNTGLSKTELTAAGFLTIQEKLTEQYSGQNATRLDTYAGKVGAVQIAYGNLQETVGGALVDAFAKLAGDTTTEDLTESVDNLADSLAAVVELVGQLATPFVFLAKLGGDFGMAITKLGYAVSGEAFMGVVKDRQYGGAAADRYKSIEETANAKARAKAEADAAKRQKELLALQKKSSIAEKNKLSLSKAAAVFDTTRVSLAAALKATYDKETRLRLEALIAIEDENGDEALRKISQLAAFQKSADLDKLKGITEISDSTLRALNTQLLTELQVINGSKMAEADKEAARQIAFGKYNAAITAAGELARKESYDERTQIQLTEIARLASLSNTSNAQTTLIKLREAEELSAIDKVMAAYKKSYDYQIEMEKYLTALKLQNLNAVSLAENDTLNRKLRGYSSSALAIAGLAATERQAAIQKLASDIGTASLQQGLAQGLSLDQAVAGARYAAQGAYNYYISITAGIGDPEAIARQVQDILNQSTYRGTSTNRDTGMYIL